MFHRCRKEEKNQFVFVSGVCLRVNRVFCIVVHLLCWPERYSICVHIENFNSSFSYTLSHFSSISYFRRAPYFALIQSIRSHTGLCSLLCVFFSLLLLPQHSHNMYSTLVCFFFLSSSSSTVDSVLCVALSVCVHSLCVCRRSRRRW